MNNDENTLSVDDEDDESVGDLVCDSCGCPLEADYQHACCPACGSDQVHDEDD